MGKRKRTIVALTVVAVMIAAALSGVVFTACSEYVDVTLDFDGGTIGGKTEMTFTVARGSEIDLGEYIPLRQGYTFDTWSDGWPGSHKGIYKVNRSVTLKPNWQRSGTATTLDAVSAIVSSLAAGETYSFAFGGTGTNSAGERTYLSLKANIENRQKYEIAFELSDETSRSLGLYIKDNVFYIYTPELGGVALADFDLDYLLSAVTAIPELAGNALGDLSVAGLPVTTLLDMVFDMFAKTTRMSADGQTVWTVNINPVGLRSISSILNLVNLDSLLAQAGLNISVQSLLDWLFQILPDIDIVLKTTIDDASGTITSLAATGDTADERVFTFTTQEASVTGGAQNIVPDEITGYVPISLGNISLSADFTVNNDGADLGALINALTGTNTVPAGLLTLDSALGYRLTLKTAIDIAQSESGDNNLIMAEIDSYAADGTAQPFIGAYYKDGALWIDVAAALGPVYGGKGIKVEIALDRLVAGVKDLVHGALDGVLGTQALRITDAAPFEAAGVLALSQSENGDYYVSDGLHNFLQAVFGVFGVSGDKVVLEHGDTYDRLTLNIDNAFIRALAASFGSALSVPDFGTVALNVTVDDSGTTVDLAADLHGVRADLSFTGFELGARPSEEGYDDIEDYIAEKIGDESKYTYSVKELVASLLSGVSADASVGLTVKAGEYDIADLLSLFGLQSTSSTAWTLEEDIVVDAVLSADVSMDPVTNAFTAQAELILNSPVEVGGTVLADAGKLIGIYAMSDKLWLDLSGIELFGAALPGAAADFAASELVAALYSAVDTYLTVDADGLFGGGDTAAALALMNADGSSAPLSADSLLSAEGAAVILDSEGLQAQLTLQAVAAMLNAFGVELSLPEGLEGQLGVRIGEDGISVNAGATIATSGQYDALGAALTLDIAADDVRTGVAGLQAEIRAAVAEKTAGLTDASSDLMRLLLDYVGQMTVSARLALTSQQGADIGAYIEGLLSEYLPDGTDVTLSLDDIDLELEVALDKAADRYSVGLYSRDGDNRTPLVSARVYGENVVATVSGIGDFILRDTGIPTSIAEAVEQAVDRIEGTDLSEILAGILPGASSGGNSGAAPDTQPSDPSDPQQPSAQDPTDIVLALLGGVSIDGLVISAALDSQLMSGIFAALGAEVDFLSADATVDIFGGSADVSVSVGDDELVLDVSLAIAKTDADSQDLAFAAALVGAFGETLPADGPSAESWLQGKLDGLGVAWDGGDDLSALAQKYTDELSRDGLVYFSDAEDVKEYLLGLLEGLSVKATLSADFAAGEYDVLELVGKFVDLGSLGLPEDASVALIFGEPSLAFDIELSAAITGGDSADSVISFALKAARDIGFGSVAGGENTVLFRQGETLLGLYVYERDLYIDASGLKLLGLTLPVFRAENFDLGTFIYDSLENALDGLLGTAVVQSAEQGASRPLATAPSDTVSLVYSEGQLEASVSMGVISSLLGKFLQGGSAESVIQALSALDGVTVGLSAGKTENGFGVGLSAEGDLLSQTNGEPSDMRIELALDSADAVIGDETLHGTLKEELSSRVQGFGQTYSDLLEGFANSLFTGSLDIAIDASFEEGSYALTETVNSILRAVTENTQLSVPVNVSAETFSKQLRLRMQWQMNPTTAEISLMAEVMNGGNILIGIYLYKGELLVDLTGVGLVRIRLSEVALIDDITAAIGDALGNLRGLDLSEILGGLLGGSANAQGALALAGDTGGEELPAAETTWIGQLLGALTLENSNIRLALSVELLESVLAAATGSEIDLADDLLDLSADLGIFDGTITFDGSLFGKTITVTVDTSLQQKTIVSSAYIPAKFTLSAYSVNASTMDGVFRALLDDIADISFTAGIELGFSAGEYNVADLLAGFGLTQLAGADLLWTFTRDTNVSLALDVNLKTYYDDTATAGDKDSMLSVELKADGDVSVGADTVYTDGTVLLGLYSYRGVMYVDASGIGVYGLSMPVFKIDFDLIGALIDKLREMRPSQDEPAVLTVAELGADAARTQTVMLPTSAADGGIEIGITENGLAVTVALDAVLALLGDFGVSVDLGGITLPELVANVTVADGIRLSVGGELLSQTGGAPSDFFLSLSVADDALSFGQDLTALENKLAEIERKYSAYGDSLVQALKDLFGSKSLYMDIEFGANAGTVDIMSLISGLVSGTGLDLGFPLNLNFDDLDFDLALNVAWDLGSRELLAEIVLKGSAQNKTLVGLYMEDSDLYISLSGVGLVDLKVEGSELGDMLFGAIEDAIAGIDDIDFSELIADFFSSDAAEELPNASAEEPSAPSDGETDALAANANDLIRYIISAVRIEDSELMIAFTDEIMSALFEMLGANTDFVIEAHAGGSIAGNTLSGSINIDDKAQFDLVMTVGDAPASFIPGNADGYTVLDLVSTPPDGRTLGEQAVVDFLNGFDFEFSLDLLSGTVGTLVDSSVGTTYTRITISKVSGVVRLDNHASTAGSADGSGILISMYDVNAAEYNSHGSGTRSAIMHVYIDYANRSATLYLCEGWLVIRAMLDIQIDVASLLSSASFELDLLTPLGKLADDLIAAVSGEQDSPSDPGTPEDPEQPASQPSRLDTALAELDINELLRPGVTLNVYSNGLTNLNVGLDPYVLNKLIDDLMSSIFGYESMIDLSTMQMNGTNLFSRNHLQYMWWDRIAGSNTRNAANGGTPYSTWDSIQTNLQGIIRDVLPKIGYGNISWLLGAINWQGTTEKFHSVFKRITSFAVFNEAQLNVNVIEGTVTNISFIGKDTGAAVTRYAQDQSGEWYDTGQKLRQTVRSLYDISGATDQQGAYYYTYEYGNNGPSHNYGGRGLLFRTGYAYYAARGVDATYGYGEYNKNYSQISYSNEIWIYNKSESVGNPAYSPSGTSGIVDWGNMATDISFNPYLYDTAGKNNAATEYWNRYFAGVDYAVYQQGSSVERATVSLTYNGSAFTRDVLRSLMDREGTHTITASAQFPSGRRTQNITFDVYRISGTGQYAIRSVDPISLHIYETVPRSVTVQTYGGTMTYRIDGSSVRLTGSYSAPSVSGGSVTAYLQFANGSRYPVTINYRDSAIEDQTVTLDWYDLDFSDKESARQQLLDMFTMLYGDGTFIPSEVTDAADWDMSALDALINRDPADLSAAEIDVTVTFDKRIAEDGSAESVESGLVQTVTLTISIAGKDKTSLTLDGQSSADIWRVDPYAYYKYLVSGNAADSPIPTAGTAVYSDGTTERLTLSPELSGVDFGYKGGSFGKAFTAKLDGAVYTGGGYFDERTALDVVVERNIVETMYFDADHTRTWLEAGEKPLTAWVVFGNGYETELPIFVGESRGGRAYVYIGIDVDMRDTHGRLAAYPSQYDFLQAFAVQVI